MRACKNFDNVSCERSCYVTGLCVENQRREDAERAQLPAALRQRPPVRNDRPAIQDLVIADIEARKQEGIRKYGTVLQAFNGRDAALDAYQEALDQAMYLRQAYDEAVEQLMRLRQFLEDRNHAGPPAVGSAGASPG